MDNRTVYPCRVNKGIRLKFPEGYSDNLKKIVQQFVQGYNKKDNNKDEDISPTVNN